jgi:hypothetical protein
MKCLFVAFFALYSCHTDAHEINDFTPGDGDIIKGER